MGLNGVVMCGAQQGSDVGRRRGTQWGDVWGDDVGLRPISCAPDPWMDTQWRWTPQTPDARPI